MKFYHTINADGFVELVDTKEQSKAAGVKTPKPFEVPTDKDGLREFVNKLYAQINPLERPPEPAAAPTSAKLTTDTVIEFILDADSYHFSNIFAAVVERFDRMKRAVEALKKEV